MVQRRGGMVRRNHPHRGTHLPDGGVVPLRQAGRHHPLGVDPRPPGHLRPPGPALYRPVSGPGPDTGVVCPALATRSHLPGSPDPPGRRDPAPVVGPGHRPHHAGSAGPLLPGPPWPPTPCKNIIPSPSAGPPGTTSRRQPSWTPSPWCDGTCGWRQKVSHCRPATPTRRNSPSLCTTDL